MAARTGKRSILTILRNKRGMRTVYQTKVICVWIIMAEYDLCNKFADNKMLLLLFKKCWTMLYALKLPCWKVKWWTIQLTFAQCEESQERRVLFRLTNSKKLAVCWAIKKVAEKAGKRKGCKRRENQCTAKRGRLSGRLATELARENSSNGKYHSSQKNKQTICICRLTIIRGTQRLL